MGEAFSVVSQIISKYLWSVTQLGIMGTDDVTDRKEGETCVWGRTCEASFCGEKVGKRRRHRDHPCCKRDRAGVLHTRTANVRPGLVGHRPHGIL
jgi:hypothetical protein